MLPVMNSWPPIRKRPRGGYVVDLRKVGGGQVKRDTLKEAKDLAQESRQTYDQCGTIAFDITPANRAQAVEVLKKLAGNMDLMGLYDFWVDHHIAVSRSMTVKDVWSDLQRHQLRSRVSTIHIMTEASRLRRFIDKFGESNIGNIDISMVDTWLESQGFTSTKTEVNVINSITMLFNHAVAQQFLTGNPLKNITKPKQRFKLPEFLPALQVNKLLQRALVDDAVMIPKLAIGFFAGIRTEELHRMEWSDIKINDRIITVRPEVSKTGVPRHVTICPCLFDWLATVTDRTTLGLKKKAFNRHRKTLCAAAGIEQWPHNAMRHSFATHHIAVNEDAGKTAFELGHTQGVGLLYRNYRGLTTKAEAQEYWKITPRAYNVIKIPKIA